MSWDNFVRAEITAESITIIPFSNTDLTLITVFISAAMESSNKKCTILLSLLWRKVFAWTSLSPYLTLTRIDFSKASMGLSKVIIPVLLFTHLPFTTLADRKTFGKKILILFIVEFEESIWILLKNGTPYNDELGSIKEPDSLLSTPKTL